MLEKGIEFNNDGQGELEDGDDNYPDDNDIDL